MSTGLNHYGLRAIQYCSEMRILGYVRAVPPRNSTKPSLDFSEAILNEAKKGKWIKAEDFSDDPRIIGRHQKTLEYLESLGRLYHGPNNSFGIKSLFDKYKQSLYENSTGSK